MNSRDAILKQINNLEGLEALYHSQGKLDIASGYNQQIQILNGELLRVSIVTAIEAKTLSIGFYK